MNRWWRDLMLILSLAGLWALGGYLIGSALEVIGFDTYRLGMILAAINVIVGMLLFLWLTREPAADRLFFGRARPDDPFTPAVGCLWIIPLLSLLVGLSMWFWAIILRLIFPE